MSVALPDGDSLMARYKALSLIVPEPDPFLEGITARDKQAIEREPEEAGAYGDPIHAASVAAKLYYRAKAPITPKGRYSEARRYYAGLICIAWAGLQSDGSGFRLSIHDGECPTRVYDFKKEKELEQFLSDAISGRPK